MYSIIQAPNENLSKTARPVEFTGPRLEKIISQMSQTLLAQKDPQGVGLAANQVGLPYRLFLTRFSTKKPESIQVFINPEIVGHSRQFLPENVKLPLEGCLSLPKYYGFVRRWKWVKLKCQTTDYGLQSTANRSAVVGSRWTVDKFSGFPALVIQHEMDHLEGKIFVERILEQNGKLYKITGKKKDGKEVWEEVTL